MMNTPTLLVLLTLNANGLTSVAFVDTDSPGQCVQRRAMITGLLTGSGSKLLEARCIESALRFSRYRHDASTSHQRQVWLIDLAAQPPRLQPMPDRRSCERRAAKTPPALCALAAQQPLGWWGRFLRFLGLD